MKRKKIISVIILTIIFLNSVIPTIALALDEVENQTKNHSAIEEDAQIEENTQIKEDNEIEVDKIENKNDSITDKEDITNETNSDTELKDESNNEDDINKNDNNSEMKKENNENDISAQNVEEISKIKYSSHIQDYGWEEQFSKADGKISGTEGKSKRIEAIKIKLGDSEKIAKNASIKYQVHVEDHGWMNWKKNGEIAGTQGESKRIEAIKIQLEGLEKYSVIYRTHIQDIGWTEWKADGEISGTEGKSKRIEAIQIQILEEKHEKFQVKVVNGKNTINQYFKNNTHYIFLSKDIDITKLVINYTGNIEKVSFGNLDTVNKTITGDFTNIENLIITLASGEIKKVSVIQSDVPALFIDLNNNISQSKLDNGSKDEKYKALLNIVGAEKNKHNISDYSIEIKGRGNTTWKMPKKPYQIKFDKKINLFDIGKDKAKKWVLLANYQDPTLIKNKIENDLSVNSTLSNIPNSKFIDLYINGNYVGNYLLCDKIEVGNGRIELNNNDGVLAEIDNAYYAEEEYNFQSSYSKNYFTIKEFKDDDADAQTKNNVMKSFKKSLENFEKILYSENSRWEQIEQLIDVNSFAKYYLVNEFAENTDAYYSSTYLYKDGVSDVIHMGPTWDYDAALGFQKPVEKGGDPNVDFTLNYSPANSYMKQLYKYPQFANIVNKIYENEIKQYFNNISVKEYANSIKNSSRINSIVWHSEEEYNKKLSELDAWVAKRISHFDRTYYASKYDSDILYITSVQNMGWRPIQKNRETSGTIGQSLKMEAIKIFKGNKLDDDVSIEYQTHIENIGWQNWVKDGEMAGTTGENLRMEAIRIKLDKANGYSIKYRVHVQDYGWMPWCHDGQTAGTEGESKRIEAIQIKLVKKPTIIINSQYNEDKNTVTATISSDKELSSINDSSWKLSADKLSYTKEYSENDTYKVTVKDVDGIESKVELKITQISEPISKIKYSSHIEKNGWEKRYSKIDGDISGTTGESKRIEAIKISLGNSEEIPENANIKYQVHVQDLGWMSEKKNGGIAGTEGESKRIEALRIRLEGMEGYSVEYRVHAQGIGWQKWRKNGEIAGTIGESKRIEAIQIRIVPIGSEILEPEVSYQAHVENIGWQDTAIEGGLAGTLNQSKRIEALKINLNEAESGAKIKYRVHVQDTGWQSWVKNGAMAGTTGQNKRIEAIQIELEGMDHYTIEYQVHIQDYGWTQWMIDGETAGTTGKEKRIEAIRIRIVPKYYRNYKGIDVSEWNGTIDWQSVKNSGVQFAMIRCAYRGYRTPRIVKDSKFEQNIQGAINAGVKVGIYFFSQATTISEGIEEANYAADLIEKYRDYIKYPIAIDTEASGADNYDGRADLIDTGTRTNVMIAFCNQIRNSGYTPMVYASRNWLYNQLQVNRLSGNEIWLAHYTGSSDKKSDYKYDYTMWQYTSSGSVAGINGRVDLNVGYKNY